VEADHASNHAARNKAGSHTSVSTPDKARRNSDGAARQTEPDSAYETVAWQADDSTRETGAARNDEASTTTDKAATGYTDTASETGAARDNAAFTEADKAAVRYSDNSAGETGTAWYHSTFAKTYKTTTKRTDDSAGETRATWNSKAVTYAPPAKARCPNGATEQACDRTAGAGSCKASADTDETADETFATIGTAVYRCTVGTGPGCGCKESRIIHKPIPVSAPAPKPNIGENNKKTANLESAINELIEETGMPTGYFETPRTKRCIRQATHRR